MKFSKKVYDLLTKNMKLSIIWIVKILFATCHFKVPFYKRIYFSIFGGFMPDQVAIYNLNRQNKKEYLSEFDWYKSRYINEPYNFILNNKLVCADLLKQYIRVPETICIKRKGKLYSSVYKISNYADIVKILIERKQLYIKPTSVGKGVGVSKITYNNNNIYIDLKVNSQEEFITFLQNRDDYFISESIEQSKVLNKIYDKTSNTIRLITVRSPKNNKSEVLFAVQRIGTKETIPVDNGTRGGLVSKIDIDTGELSSAKSIQKLVDFTHHPDSKNPIKGVKIENWDQIKRTFVDIMEKLPYLYFIAWDILITDEGPVVIEANASSGINILQLWGGQRDRELGEFYKYHKIIK